MSTSEPTTTMEVEVDVDAPDSDFVLVGRGGKKQVNNNSAASAAENEENEYYNQHQQHYRRRRYRGGGTSRKKPPPAGGGPPSGRRQGGGGGVPLQQSNQGGTANGTGGVKDIISLKLASSTNDKCSSESSSIASGGPSGAGLSLRNRMLSGDSASLSSSENDNENGNNAKTAEVEVVITPAPPPKVNPWRVNANAAQVITNKVTIVSTTTSTTAAPIGSKPPTQQQAHHRSQQKPVITNNTTKAVTVTQGVPPAAAKNNKKSDDIANANIAADLPTLIRPPPAITNHHQPKQWKTNQNQQQQQQAQASASIDWPTLGEATGKKSSAAAAGTTPPSAGPPPPQQGKAVRFRSNTTDSTDSGSEDLIAPLPPPKTALQLQNDTDGQASGSSEENEDGTGQTRRVTKSRKTPKQKWLPLEIPSSGEGTNGTKAGHQQPHNKARGHHRRNGGGGGPGAPGIMRGNGRGSGGRGRRPMRGSANGGAGDAPTETTANSVTSTQVLMANGEYADFPPDFTTLVPVYPGVTDFVMPYVWNGFVNNTSQQQQGQSAVPSTSAVVQDGQVASIYGTPPVDTGIILELVKKQM